ncbi:MAG: class I adenylate-forming enzyme family protein, partial [Alphaproteobacteria bacterium]
MSVFKMLQDAVKKWPDNLFLVRENISYKAFLENVRLRAITLHNFGVQKGDVVGVLAHNIPEFPLTVFAIWYLGATVLLLDTNLTDVEYDNMTKTVGAKLVCAEKHFFYDAKKFKFYDITLPDAESDLDLKPEKVNENDFATMSFTSGSTGVPKVVPLTHRNLMECANSMESFNTWIHYGDVMYGFLPLYHVFGFAIGLLTPLHYGTCILLQPTVNPKAILEDFKTYKPQVIPAVPRLWEIFRNKIIDGVKAQKKWWIVSRILKYQKFLRFIGLGNLVHKVQKPLLNVFGGRAKLLIAGGAATKPEVEKFYEQLGLAFVQGYGMTETVGPVCCSRPVKKRVPFAFGAPIGCNECEIRNKDKKGVGTLWIRSPQVFTGYLNNPEINAGIFDDKGFFNTGDLVFLDKNGEYHFAGRKKNVIVLDSGKNVYPDELEALYMEIPGVKNVAVFEHKVKDKTVAYGVFSVDK